MSRAAEVAFGEAQEKRVLRRWMAVKGIDPASVRVIASRAFQDWDFLLLDGDGYPMFYVEVKVRRTSFGKYGDAIAPYRKHEAACRLRDREIEFVMVTEYPDALVELNLAHGPSDKRMVKRRDRPGSKPVLHGFWSEGQLSVLEGDDA